MMSASKAKPNLRAVESAEDLTPAANPYNDPRTRTAFDQEDGVADCDRWIYRAMRLATGLSAVNSILAIEDWQKSDGIERDYEPLGGAVTEGLQTAQSVLIDDLVSDIYEALTRAQDRNR